MVLGKSSSVVLLKTVRKLLVHVVIIDKPIITTVEKMS